jgi:hypothetical protein
MYTESTTYEYFESLDTPKQWFKANVAKIMELYGAQHSIQKEDLYLGEWVWVYGGSFFISRFFGYHSPQSSEHLKHKIMRFSSVINILMDRSVPSFRFL